ncbi:hypothetical protein [Pseudonocardia xishanensis]|uniref:Uncharacterized protein n=1 Tax=Pseudonocardia xishanensis TaxID=630995 RepID=A0ABP8RR24_9PSEU
MADSTGGRRRGRRRVAGSGSPAPGGGACGLDLLEREGRMIPGAPLDRVPTNVVLERRTGLADVLAFADGTGVVSLPSARSGQVIQSVRTSEGSAHTAFSPDGTRVYVSARSGAVLRSPSRPERTSPPRPG